MLGICNLLCCVFFFFYCFVFFFFQAEDGIRDWSVTGVQTCAFRSLFIQMPAALMFPSGNRFYDWEYQTDEEPHMGRRVDHARGKVLGGSSSINGMIYQRGNPMDYEGWAEPEGMDTWDFAHCLPYFKKLETTYGAAPYDKVRGHDGPIKLKRGPATNPLFKSFFNADVEAGYHKTADVNG